MQHLKEINTKLSSKTESSHDARAEHCSCCGENGHNGALTTTIKRKEMSKKTWYMRDIMATMASQEGLSKITIHTIRVWGIRTFLGGATLSYNQMHLWTLKDKLTSHHLSNNSSCNLINNKVGVGTMMMMLSVPFSKLWVKSKKGETGLNPSLRTCPADWGG